jgi:hypothetical protein
MTIRRFVYYVMFSLWGTLMMAGCDTFLAEPLVLNGTPFYARIDAVMTAMPLKPDATPTATLAPTTTPMPFALESAISVMSGLCFESVADAAGQVFVMRSAEEHIHLYDLAENSELCRRPIIRHPFNFDNGRVLAGTWTYGIGCTADHDILNVSRDDARKVITIDLRFVTYGDCPYELVRPFWVALDDAQDYEIMINVS